LVLATGARITAGIVMLTIVGIESGGLFLLRTARSNPGFTDFQRSFFRAGHAHAGVLVILGLLCLVLTGATGLTGFWAWLAGTGVLKELRTQTFLPWIEKLWDTPNVAHDNPHDQRFHASLMLGFTDTAARDAFFTGDVIQDLSDQLAPLVSAIHAYDVTAALTYVKNGDILPHYQE
jgi:hypothetical protein